MLQFWLYINHSCDYRKNRTRTGMMLIMNVCCFVSELSSSILMLYFMVGKKICSQWTCLCSLFFNIICYSCFFHCYTKQSMACIYFLKSVFRLSSLSHLFISRMISTSNGYTTLHYFPPPVLSSKVTMKAFHFLSQYHFFPFIWKSSMNMFFYVSTGADQRTIWKMAQNIIFMLHKYLQPTLWPNKPPKLLL